VALALDSVTLDGDVFHAKEKAEAIH